VLPSAGRWATAARGGGVSNECLRGNPMQRAAGRAAALQSKPNRRSRPVQPRRPLWRRRPTSPLLAVALFRANQPALYSACKASASRRRCWCRRGQGDADLTGLPRNLFGRAGVAGRSKGSPIEVDMQCGGGAARLAARGESGRRLQTASPEAASRSQSADCGGLSLDGREAARSLAARRCTR
jgi:hypothetical protein